MLIWKLMFIICKLWLLDQLDFAEDDKLPYGLAVMPYSDRDGSFVNQKMIWENLVKQLYGKYRLRFVEAGSQSEIVKKFKSCGDSYSQHKISFLFLVGHGTPSSVRFGEEAPGERLTSEDVKQMDKARLQKFFVDNPRVILISCSTGVDDGIAQILSELGVEVTAFKIDSPLTSIKANISFAQVDFEVGPTSNVAKFKEGKPTS